MPQLMFTHPLCSQKIFLDLQAEGFPVVETSTLTEKGLSRVKTGVQCSQMRQACPDASSPAERCIWVPCPLCTPSSCPVSVGSGGPHSHHGSSAPVLPPWFLHWARLVLTQEGRQHCAPHSRSTRSALGNFLNLGS